MNFANPLFGAKVISSSSEVPGCSAEHVLSEDLSKIWLSEEGIPQWLCISLQDLSNLSSVEVRTVGWYCWHSYSTNPREVRLHVSRDGAKFRIWDTMTADRQRAGSQLFCIEPISASLYPFIAFEIMTTFGGSQTYVNQLYLFSEEVSNSFVLSTSVDDIDLREFEVDDDRAMSDDSLSIPLVSGPDVTQRLEEALGISDDVTLSSFDSFDETVDVTSNALMTFPVYEDKTSDVIAAAESATSLGLLAVSSAALHSSSPLPAISVDSLKSVAALTGSVTSAVARDSNPLLEERLKELEERFVSLLASQNSNSNKSDEVVREVEKDTSVAPPLISTSSPTTTAEEERRHSQEVQTDVSLLAEMTSEAKEEKTSLSELNNVADVSASTPSKPLHCSRHSQTPLPPLPLTSAIPREHPLEPNRKEVEEVLLSLRAMNRMTSPPRPSIDVSHHQSKSMTSSLAVDQHLLHYGSALSGEEGGRGSDVIFSLPTDVAHPSFPSPNLRLQKLLHTSERKSSSELTSREVQKEVVRDSVRRAIRQQALDALTQSSRARNSRLTSSSETDDDVDLEHLVRQLHEAVTQKTIKEAQLKILQERRHSHHSH